MKKKRTRPVPLCLAMLMPIAALSLICWSLCGQATVPDIRIKPMIESSTPEDAAAETTDASAMGNACADASAERLADPLVLRHQAR